MAALAGLLALTTTALAWAKPPIDPRDPPPDPPFSGHLDRTENGHLSGSVPPPLPGTAPFWNLPSIDESPWVVLGERKTPYWKAGTFDPVLTNACRRGEFATAPMNRMVLRFVGPVGQGVLQVVLPTHRHLLYDARHLARPRETYFFLSTGQPDCQVWIQGKVAPRKLSATGSSLPPRDPLALQKKKALIKSWPQPK